MLSQMTQTAQAPSIAQFFDQGDARQIKIGRHVGAKTEKQLDDHEHLFVAGEAQTHVYQILEGVVGIYELLPDGRRQIVTFCYPGDLIGADNPAQFMHNAEALCKSRVRCIPLKAMDHLISNDPEFSQALLKVLATELAETRDQLMSLGRKSALEKVATFLLRIANRNAREGQDNTLLHLPMTRAEIADYLGLTIETVSRNITKLKVANAIKLQSGSRVQVTDMALLESYAESADK